MVYKWNEINYENFREILDGFMNGESWSLGKVLELQNIYGISCGLVNDRMYLGKDIKITDWNGAAGNKKLMSTLELLSRTIGYESLSDFLEKEIDISVLKVAGGIDPIAMPIMKGSGVEDVMFNSLFGDTRRNSFMSGTSDYNSTVLLGTLSMSVWYTKDEDTGKYIVHLDPKDKKKYTDSERMIRCRSIDVSDFNEMMKKYKADSKDKSLFWKDKDIQGNQIEVEDEEEFDKLFDNIYE